MAESIVMNRMRSNELRTREAYAPRSAWKLKLLLVTILIVLIAVGIVGVLLYQKMSVDRATRDFLLAQSLYQKGNVSEAVPILVRLYQGFPSLPEREDVIYYLANSASAANKASAEPYWDSLLGQFPKGTHAPEALVCLAKIADASGNAALSKQRWDRLRSEYPNSEGAGLAEVSQADTLAKSGKIEEARKSLYAVLENVPPGAVHDAAIDKLSELNTAYLFSAAPNEWNQVVQIGKGETLIRLANKYKTTAAFIAKANGFELTKKLSPGQQLTIPSIGSYKIVVSKDDLYLYLYTSQGKFIKRYRCCTGREERLTPPGNYVIRHKLKEPPWFDTAKGRIVKPGEPDYPLGTRWMTITPAEKPDAPSRLGIHGTNKPETIGQKASDGCVRLLNENVEELYIIVPMRTPVEIVFKGAAALAPAENTSATPEQQSSVAVDWLNPQLRSEE